MLDRRTLLSRFLGCLGLVPVVSQGQAFKIQLDVEDGLLDQGFHPVPLDRLKLAPGIIAGIDRRTLDKLADDIRNLRLEGGQFLITVSQQGDVIDGSRHVYVSKHILGMDTVMCHVVSTAEVSLQRWRNTYHIGPLGILPKTVWRYNWLAS